MSSYVTSRTKFVTALTSTGINEIRAHAFARLWEYEATRQSKDVRDLDFWVLGRTFVDGLLERDRVTALPD